MLFNSIDFAIFLPTVFIIYWYVFNFNLRLQNCLIVLASYVFYGWWDWRFLSLILFSTIVDYSVGLLLKTEKTETKRKLYLFFSIVVNIGLLGFFKYFNFFVDNFVSVFSFFGAQFNAHSLRIILPVGISFYTFQTLSYTIDVYNKKLEPTHDFFAFAAFVSFFPQLVAGPIERATNLLPQFHKKREFHYDRAVDGLRQILWGLFKKMVIADKCAESVNQIFNNSNDYTGSTLLLGAVLFAFQIYGDFSGYSDIAIGTARLFGFSLMRNFAFPYFARDIAEFWRRWHISLSTWFRDYLYIPLGGSRGGPGTKVRNTFLIFIVSGFWHGANWTFIIWGAIHAIYFLPLLLMNKNRNHLEIVARKKWLPSIRELFKIGLTFGLTTLAWIFFRANNVRHAVHIFSKIFSLSVFTFPQVSPWWVTVILLFIFIGIEWTGRDQSFALANLGLNWSRPLRHALYYAIILAIFWLGGKEQQFIYFQF